MRRLRFQTELYTRAVIDRAAAGYQAVAEIKVSEQPGEIAVEIHAPAEKERRVAGELGNAVLGLTVEDRG
jgi:hypothetical protein